jgi:hypothetical protein
VLSCSEKRDPFAFLQRQRSKKKNRKSEDEKTAQKQLLPISKMMKFTACPDATDFNVTSPWMHLYQSYIIIFCTLFALVILFAGSLLIRMAQRDGFRPTISKSIVFLLFLQGVGLSNPSSSLLLKSSILFFLFADTFFFFFLFSQCE